MAPNDTGWVKLRVCFHELRPKTRRSTFGPRTAAQQRASISVVEINLPLPGSRHLWRPYVANDCAGQA